MRQSAPAVARNRLPLLEVLRRVLPSSGTVLEVASGSGEHAAFFAEHLPKLTWQASDLDADARASCDAWRLEARLPNLLPALALDACADAWPSMSIDALLNVNMLHISPWAACLGLMRHGGALLSSGAPLLLYGPYRRSGVETAPSNEAFDASLRARNAAWGLRQLDDVVAAARAQALELEEIVEMPANNLTVVLRRR